MSGKDSHRLVYEEGRRKLDHQAEDIREYQRQAGLFLRISIATVGILLTAVSYGGTSRMMTEFLDSILNLELTEVTLAFAQSSDSGTAIASVFIVLVLWSASIFSVVVSLAMVGYVIPKNAYKAAYPVQTEPGLDPAKIDNQSPSEDVALPELTQIINQNQKVVEAKRKSLQNCLKGARIGIRLAIIAPVALYSLSEPDPISATASIVIIALLVWSTLDFSAVPQNLTNIFRFSPALHPPIIIALFGITLEQFDLYQILRLVSALGILLHLVLVMPYIIHKYNAQSELNDAAQALIGLGLAVALSFSISITTPTSIEVLERFQDWSTTILVWVAIICAVYLVWVIAYNFGRDAKSTYRKRIEPRLRRIGKEGS